MLSQIVKSIRLLLFVMFLFLPSLIILMITGFWAAAHQYFAPLGFTALLINFVWLFTKRGQAAVRRGFMNIAAR